MKTILNKRLIISGLSGVEVTLTEAQFAELISADGEKVFDGEHVVLKAEAVINSAVSQIKSIAGEVISAIAPDYQQRNMLANALRIENKQRLGESTAEEDATAISIIAQWERIEAIRTKSDELEAQYISAGEELTENDLVAIRADLEAAGA